MNTHMPASEAINYLREAEQSYYCGRNAVDSLAARIAELESTVKPPKHCRCIGKSDWQRNCITHGDWSGGEVVRVGDIDATVRKGQRFRAQGVAGVFDSMALVNINDQPLAYLWVDDDGIRWSMVASVDAEVSFFPGGES